MDWDAVLTGVAVVASVKLNGAACGSQETRLSAEHDYWRDGRQLIPRLPAGAGPRVHHVADVGQAFTVVGRGTAWPLPTATRHSSLQLPLPPRQLRGGRRVPRQLRHDGEPAARHQLAGEGTRTHYGNLIWSAATEVSYFAEFLEFYHVVLMLYSVVAFV